MALVIFALKSMEISIVFYSFMKTLNRIKELAFAAEPNSGLIGLLFKAMS